MASISKKIHFSCGKGYLLLNLSKHSSTCVTLACCNSTTAHAAGARQHLQLKTGVEQKYFSRRKALKL